MGGPDGKIILLEVVAYFSDWLVSPHLDLHMMTRKSWNWLTSSTSHYDYSRQRHSNFFKLIILYFEVKAVVQIKVVVVDETFEDLISVYFQ